MLFLLSFLIQLKKITQLVFWWGGGQSHSSLGAYQPRNTVRVFLWRTHSYTEEMPCPPGKTCCGSLRLANPSTTIRSWSCWHYTGMKLVFGCVLLSPSEHHPGLHCPFSLLWIRLPSSSVLSSVSYIHGKSRVDVHPFYTTQMMSVWSQMEQLLEQLFALGCHSKGTLPSTGSEPAN